MNRRSGMSGNRVSHANNKTKRRFKTNILYHRIWVPELERFVRVRISNRELRSVMKNNCKLNVLEELCERKLS
jgi:large subunit ribosomal protein L28